MIAVKKSRPARRLPRVAAVVAALLFLIAPSVRAGFDPPTPKGFAEGMGAVQIDGKWGYIDHAADLVIPAQFDQALDFYRGYAWVSLAGQYAYIDHTGQIQPPDAPPIHSGPRVAHAPLAEGLKAFWEARPDGNALWGYRNARGETVMSPKYDHTGRFSEGFATFTERGPQNSQKSGYLDLWLNEVIPARWWYASSFSEGLAAVLDGGRYTFIDAAGKPAFPGDFRSAFPFSEGLAAVDLHPEENSGNTIRPGQWVYIDRTDRQAFDTDFEKAEPFRGGVAEVRIDGRWGLIDSTGDFLIAPTYRAIQRMDDRGDRFRVDVSGDDNYYRSGVVDRTGRVVIEPRYRSVTAPSEGLLAVRGDEKWGYIDARGREVIGFHFDIAGPFREGLAMVTQGDTHGYIDRRGNWFWKSTTGQDGGQDDGPTGEDHPPPLP